MRKRLKSVIFLHFRNNYLKSKIFCSAAFVNVVCLLRLTAGQKNWCLATSNSSGNYIFHDIYRSLLDAIRGCFNQVCLSILVLSGTPASRDFFWNYHQIQFVCENWKKWMFNVHLKTWQTIICGFGHQYLEMLSWKEVLVAINWTKELVLAPPVLFQCKCPFL